MKRLAPLAILAAATASHAAFTVTDLHPATALTSVAWSVRGGVQAGVMRDSNTFMSQASLWTGTSASWVNLNPVSAMVSGAAATDGLQQVGEVRLFSAPSVDRATVWAGSAASYVDLHPTGASRSYARAVQSGVQGGYAEFGGNFQASLWTGTAGSWQSLHPGGATDSYLHGLDGAQQFGEVTIAGSSHASLWSGTAASWVDLHPGVATDSYGWFAEGGQQVGEAIVGGSRRASLWNGSAASWTDLTVGAGDASAFGVHNGWQVGYATVGGIERASLWNGTSASWVDLHVAGFASTRAYSIWSDANFTYIAGYGVDPNNSMTHALLWTQPVPEPATLAVLSFGALLIARRRRKS